MRVAKLAALMASLGCALEGCGNDSAAGEQGVCDGAFLYESDYSSIEDGASLVDLKVCVVNETEGDPEVYEIRAGTVSDSLVVDGGARESVVVFPLLTSASNIIALRCALSAAEFPVLSSVDSIDLACDRFTRSPVFVFRAAALVNAPTISVSGPAKLAMEMLQSVDDMILFSLSDLDELFATSNDGELHVKRLEINSAELDTLRLNRISHIDRLEILNSSGDIALDILPHLRRVQTVTLGGNPSITQCAFDAFIARLEAAPDTINLDSNLPLRPCD